LLSHYIYCNLRSQQSRFQFKVMKDIATLVRNTRYMGLNLGYVTACHGIDAVMMWIKIRKLPTYIPPSHDSHLMLCFLLSLWKSCCRQLLTSIKN